MRITKDVSKRAASLYTKLKKLRKKKGITQREVAELLGLTINSVWSHENGTVQPSRKAWENYATLYGGHFLDEVMDMLDGSKH